MVAGTLLHCSPLVVSVMSGRSFPSAGSHSLVSLLDSHGRFDNWFCLSVVACSCSYQGKNSVVLLVSTQLLVRFLQYFLSFTRNRKQTLRSLQIAVPVAARLASTYLVVWLHSSHRIDAADGTLTIKLSNVTTFLLPWASRPFPIFFATLAFGGGDSAQGCCKPC